VVQGSAAIFQVLACLKNAEKRRLYGQGAFSLFTPWMASMQKTKTWFSAVL
jgi:hypothetical protein